MTTGPRVLSLHRYAVKSLQGEQLGELTIESGGVVGDRAFALVDRADGRIASAKHPHKWRRLLELRAAYTDTPSATPHVGQVRIELPDGASYAGDAPGLGGALARFIGREVALVAGPVADARAEMVWPDIDGLAPSAVIDAAAPSRSESGERMGEMPLGSQVASFVDWAPVHLITTSTLRGLARHEPAAVFDARRFRPNVLVDVPGDDPVENDWTGATLGFASGVELHVAMPTVRCVMTTLAQGDLVADRRTLQTIVRVNRLDVPAFGGAWACAGVYADVARPGSLRVGDALTVAP